jgi:membrane protease YdiL (CAAX protease family)
MENREWKAKSALACYFASILGGLVVAYIAGNILFFMGLIEVGATVVPSDLPFPVTLLTTPINSIILLAITFWFAKNKGASLEQLGLKNVSFKILAIVSAVAVLLSLLQVGIFLGQETVFGPDPLVELVNSVSVREGLTPRDSFQLVALIVITLVLAGPSLELALRGFIQKGLENSFGKMAGLLIASVLYAGLGILSGLYMVVPMLVVGLVFGYVWQQTDGNTIASALMNGVTTSIVIAILYFFRV